MKPILKTSLLICFLIALVDFSYASKRDSVLLIGIVFNDQNRVSNVEIEVYQDNKLIKKVKVKTNRFRTYLPINSKLTISIGASGYHAKRFIFDTTLPKNITRIPSYNFDIDIFKEEELAGVNTSFLDFPVGLVSYNEKKGAFVRNKKYSNQMRKAYLKLWGEAQSKERAGFENSEE